MDRVHGFRPEAIQTKHLTIYAPPGGVDEIVLAFRHDQITTFDLTVGQGNTRRSVRITPNRDFVAEDPSRPTVDHYHAAHCRFLDYNGEETAEFSNCALYLNAQVTAEGTPCGELRVWPLAKKSKGSTHDRQTA
jgi:hypothetical protein